MSGDERIAHTGRVLDHVDNYSVVDCRTCGFLHLDPIPGNDKAQAFYDEQYFQHSKPDLLDEDEREVEHRNIFFDERLRFFRAHAPGRRLLDVGCGDGLFLSRASSDGWVTRGIEPSRHAAAIGVSRGLDVVHTTLDRYFERNHDGFDVIHLKNVLEHLPDPARALRTCYDLLVPGGILYIEVPNDYDLSQRFGVWLLRERKSWIVVPDHINYFDFASAERLVRRLRFAVTRRDTTFPMYIFLCLGLNFIKNKDLGKRLHRWRVRFELFCARHHLNRVRQFAYGLLAKVGFGRTAILYCQKPEKP